MGKLIRNLGSQFLVCLRTKKSLLLFWKIVQEAVNCCIVKQNLHGSHKTTSRTFNQSTQSKQHLRSNLRTMEHFFIGSILSKVLLGFVIGGIIGCTIHVLYNADQTTFYGGTMTYRQLATKFSWPTVIVSIVFLPFLLLWSKLLAFPQWLPESWRSRPLLTVRNTFLYNGNTKEGISAAEVSDLFRNRVYSSETNVVSTSPSGWNCHVDEEGGKFFESFWGIMHCLDIQCRDDGSDRKRNHWVITPNKWSWLRLDNVFVEFCEGDTRCGGHRVRFYFPLDGPNRYNPCTWITIGFAVTALNYFAGVSFKEFKERYGVTTHPEFPVPTGSCLSLRYPEDSTEGAVSMPFRSMEFRDYNGGRGFANLATGVTTALGVADNLSDTEQTPLL